MSGLLLKARKYVNVHNFTILLLGVVLLMLAQHVFAASTDTEFKGLYDTVASWCTGNLGKTIAVGFLLVGLGVGIVRGSIMSVVACVAATVALLLGPEIINTIFGDAGSGSSGG